MNLQQHQHAEEVLAVLDLGPIRPYSTYEFGRSQDENCLSVVLSVVRAKTVLPEVRARLSDGLVAFLGTKGGELVVGAGKIQFDMVRLARTQAVHYNLSTEDIIGKLEEFDREFGISIWHAESDEVEFNLLKYPNDINQFAQSLFELCPDIVHQGAGTIEQLAFQIEITSYVRLWWD